MIKKILFGVLILWTLFIVAGFTALPSEPGSLSVILVFGVLPWLLVWAVCLYHAQQKRKVQQSIINPLPPVKTHLRTDSPSRPQLPITPPATPAITSPATQSATQQPITPPSSTTTGMDEETYQGFRHLVQMALADGVVAHEEAQYLFNYLMEKNGNWDSRTRHLAIVLNATLRDGVFDEVEAEEMRVLLGEFVDADLHPTPKPAPKPQPKPKQKVRRRTVAESSPYSGLILEGRTYDFIYSDVDGNVTDRRVHVREITFNSAGNEIVKGRCYLANATRSFRRDRILTAIDIDTGEICI